MLHAFARGVSKPNILLNLSSLSNINLKRSSVFRMSSSSTINKFIDTHIHIDYIMEKVPKPISEVANFVTQHFRIAPQVKGKTIPMTGEWEGSIHIACDPDKFDNVKHIAEVETVYVGAGVHPHHAKMYNDHVEEALLEIHKNPKVVAWGEMGLDYHYNLSPPEVQREVFARQLKTAVSIGKPLIIHTREAEEDTFEIMTKVVPADWKIHIHCFTSSKVLAKKFLDHFPNLVIGFTGVITFGNAADIQEVVAEVPLERIVLETDGPFLAPVPFRGQPAISSMIPMIAKKISEIKKVSIEEVFQHARENTTKVYSI